MRDLFFDRFFPERGYRRTYLETLSYQHRSFDVKGLTTQGTFTLELAQIFVDLALVPQSRQSRVPSDPIRQSLPILKDGRHDLWTYLSAKQLRSRNLVIIGPPGSGKTTLLKHVTLTLAADDKPRNSAKIDALPILLFLRDHAPTIMTEPSFSLVQAVQERLKIWDVSIPADWFEAALQRGQCLVMLDGLDEVADAAMRQHVVDWVQRQIQRYGKNRFLISSRPFGYYSNPLQQVTLLDVRPFTIEQVKKFVHNWYLANEIMSAQKDDPGVRMDARRGAEDLLWRLRQVPVLLEMAVNPLLLTMIATVHRYRSSLPGRRVELYAEICEVFLGKRQQARGLTFDLTPAQKQRVLQSLAYYMMRHNMREIAIEEAIQVIEYPLQRVKGPQQKDGVDSGEEFLKTTENSSGLIVEREVGFYSFAHLTFQEYLAAAHVLDQKLEQELIKWVEDSWWHETIRLYAAQSDATNIIKACLALKRPSVPALTLAMECLEEAREVRPELRSIFERLARSVDHTSPEVRQIAAEVFLMLRLRRMLRIDETKYVDTAPITHSEYQLFLSESRLERHYHHPDHWHEAHYASGAGRTPVVGVRPADAEAFCRWLTARSPGEAWRYRLPQANELKSDAMRSETFMERAEDAGFWFTSQSGYQCIGVNRPELMQQLTAVLSERFHYDWDLNEPEQRDARFFEELQKLVLRRAHQRQFTLLDLDRDLTMLVEDQPNLEPELQRVRDRAMRDLVTDLDDGLREAIAAVNNPNLNVARDVNLDEVVQLANDLVQDVATALDLETPRSMTHEIVRSVNYASDLTANRQVVMYQELDRALNNALRHSRELAMLIDRAYVRARTRIRAGALAALLDLLREIEQKRAGGVTRAGENVRPLLAAFIDLYLDMALLEERIAGKLPAFEGIRLVRERQEAIS